MLVYSERPAPSHKHFHLVMNAQSTALGGTVHVNTAQEPIDIPSSAPISLRSASRPPCIPRPLSARACTLPGSNQEFTPKISSAQRHNERFSNFQPVLLRYHVCMS